MAVNVSGNFTEKLRQNNGLEKVGPYLNNHRLVRVPVVGYVEWHGHQESRTGDKVAVIIPAIEPGITSYGGDIDGLPVQDGYPQTAGAQIMWLLDMLRKQGGIGAVADTLFSVPSEDIHHDDDDDAETRYPGEETIPGADPIVRTGPDGDRVVPEASADEIMAERAEAAAIIAAAAAAAFSGGDQ